MAKRKGEPQIQETTDFSPREALQRARSILLPTSILEALKSSRIDTLIVLPTFAIGTIPFGLLPVDERRALIDLVSVTIAPGFFVFERPPSVARASFGNAMIIGNPVGWNDKAMSAAAVQMFGTEAEAIATNFGTKAMTGATKATVIARLGVEHPSLIYIAAHGRSDSVNPLDGGFLLLGDGPWTGREISRAPIGDSRPLVILSACQTGLGKDFDVGNIGLARAWYQAGASNVVMSLWSIYREATQNLMLRFTRYLSTCPPDQALQRAMIEQRGVGQDDPRLWAGFAIFGLPEHPGCTTPGP